MENSPIIFLSIDNEEKIYYFNFANKKIDQSNISRIQRAANGYGVFVEIDEEKKIAAILGFDESVYFLFDRSLYRLDDESLTVTQRDGFLKNRFQLFVNGKREIDINYKQIWDIENDIFWDVKDWLEIKPREKLLFELSKYADFLKEGNIQRRADFS
ncbi:hypothetical protein [Acinetobacter modestus]|uniref:hypothetical protein n=1 Tax=Acinetobacter modestus TaxID=1776740 RepID=UPI001F4A30B9|nr:hypothetical protein [Acinetobacter modestus]MCH7333353.1 hypothetical protein [Acinetobacter modestus]